MRPFAEIQPPKYSDYPKNKSRAPNLSSSLRRAEFSEGVTTTRSDVSQATAEIATGMMRATLHCDPLVAPLRLSGAAQTGVDELDISGRTLDHPAP